MRYLLRDSKAGTRVVYDINSSPIDLSNLHTPSGEIKLFDKFYPGSILIIQELLYADDCVLYAESEAHLQELVSAYNKAAEAFGQQVSQQKTKIMVVQSSDATTAVIPPSIRLNPTDQSTLQVATEFSYLGSIDSQNGDTSIELNQRIVKMRGAYFRLQGRVFENNALSLTPKLCLYKCL